MLLMGMSGELNPKQHHKMERLKENGVRLLTLINDILDITRIEARRVEIVNKPFSPRALTERIAAQMAALAERSGLEFTTSIDPIYRWCLGTTANRAGGRQFAVERFQIH